MWQIMVCPVCENSFVIYAFFYKSGRPVSWIYWEGKEPNGLPDGAMKVAKGGPVCPICYRLKIGSMKLVALGIGTRVANGSLLVLQGDST